jgi:hypothetical protein
MRDARLDGERHRPTLLPHLHHHHTTTMSSQNSDEIDFITGDGVDSFAGPSSGTGTPGAGAADGDMDDAAEIEAMKARVAEMEAEAAKLRDMQADAEREAGGAPGAAAPGPSEEEKEEVDGRSVYVGNVSVRAAEDGCGWTLRSAAAGEVSRRNACSAAVSC